MGGPHSEDASRDGMEAVFPARAEAITGALESLSDAVVVFDSDERLLYCNKRYRELTPETAALHVPGATIEQLLHARLDMGLYPEARGREEGWLAENLREFRSGIMAREQPLA
ncbi:MAG: PAS-domain containing protein, partial [Pseudomonadota bacterium]|nr:PAS-domain containing protein [Pseudomonadota bacterium]